MSGDLSRPEIRTMLAATYLAISVAGGNEMLAEPLVRLQKRLEKGFSREELDKIYSISDVAFGKRMEKAGEMKMRVQEKTHESVVRAMDVKIANLEDEIRVMKEQARAMAGGVVTPEAPEKKTSSYVPRRKPAPVGAPAAAKKDNPNFDKDRESFYEKAGDRASKFVPLFDPNMTPEANSDHFLKWAATNYGWFFEHGYVLVLIKGLRTWGSARGHAYGLANSRHDVKTFMRNHYPNVKI